MVTDMKMRLTDAQTFAIEFEADSEKDFIIECKKATLRCKSRFLEVQFIDVDDVWRLPTHPEKWIVYQFNPKMSSDYSMCWLAIQRSDKHLRDVSEMARKVAWGESPNLTLV